MVFIFLLIDRICVWRFSTFTLHSWPWSISSGISSTFELIMDIWYGGCYIILPFIVFSVIVLLHSFKILSNFHLKFEFSNSFSFFFLSFIFCFEFDRFLKFGSPILQLSLLSFHLRFWPAFKLESASHILRNAFRIFRYKALSCSMNRMRIVSWFRFLKRILIHSLYSSFIINMRSSCTSSSPEIVTIVISNFLLSLSLPLLFLQSSSFFNLSLKILIIPLLLSFKFLRISVPHRSNRSNVDIIWCASSWNWEICWLD